MCCRFRWILSKYSLATLSTSLDQSVPCRQCANNKKAADWWDRTTWKTQGELHVFREKTAGTSKRSLYFFSSCILVNPQLPRHLLVPVYVPCAGSRSDSEFESTLNRQNMQYTCKSVIDHAWLQVRMRDMGKDGGFVWAFNVFTIWRMTCIILYGINIDIRFHNQDPQCTFNLPVPHLTH
jgi:hypothetical protein